MIIDDIIQQSSETKIKLKDRKFVYRSVMAYVLRVIDSRTLTVVLRKQAVGCNPVHLRQLIRQGYVLKNLKLWLYYNVSLDSTIQQADSNRKKFGVKKDDLKCYALLISSIDYYSDVRKLAKNYPAFTLKRFEKEVNSVLTEQSAYTKKYVYRKLRFTTNGGGHSLEDLLCDLRIKGIEGIYSKYPKIDSLLHLTNVYKSSIKNYGCNLIKKHTTQKHGVLVANKDGSFESRKVSLDAGEPGFLDSKYSVGFDGTSKDTTESKMKAIKIVESVPASLKKLLTLLTGEYNKKFSKFLAKNKIKYNNDDFFDRLLLKSNIREYVNWAAKFLNMNPYLTHIELTKLRNKFA